MKSSQEANLPIIVNEYYFGYIFGGFIMITMALLQIGYTIAIRAWAKDKDFK